MQYPIEVEKEYLPGHSASLVSAQSTFLRHCSTARANLQQVCQKRLAQELLLKKADFFDYRIR